MPRLTLRALLLAVLAAFAIALAGCGDDDDSDGGGELGALPAEQDTGGKRGGTLTVLASDDVDSLDPGIAYAQFSYQIIFASHRTLYQFRPDDTDEPSPDLAEGEPQVSPDGKTVTVKIKRGVRFSPPVNREVTSADVKYAIERGFSESVANQYAGVYFASIEGVPAEPGPYQEISGIQTPDEQTIVFKLTEPTAPALIGAMALPLTAPVPKEYAEEFDRQSPSTYAENVVFTGPYMVENDDEGKLTGYEPKRRIHLVRNPNWDGATDFRPAYLNEIEVREGNDAVPASRRILRGEGLVTGDISVPPEALREAQQRYRDQVALAPSGGNRYIALNTAIPPFDDPNVRKAVTAWTDREALRLTRGGAAIGDVATHLIPPGIPGFEEAGGLEGPDLDYLRNPKGDREVAERYFRAAGFQSGRYEGDEEILFVGDSDDPGSKTFQVAADQFRRMGFKLKTRQAPHLDLLTEVCGVPDQRVHVCVAPSWAKDFNDPQTILQPTFSGDAITDTNPTNWSLLDDDRVDEAIEKASAERDPAQRANAWGEVDRLIMEQAAAIPYLWDKTANARSANVKGVIQRFNSSWDLSFTSLK